MFQKFLHAYAESIAVRIASTGFLFILPIGITTSWLGAAYLMEFSGASFHQVFWGLLFFGLISVFTSGFLSLYFFERYVIQQRAAKSWGWVVIRILLYLLASVPEGYATLLGIRFGVGTYPHSVENIYFVQVIAMSPIMALLYTLAERAVAEIRQREAGLKKQIETLRIEIDQMKREKQVKEIVDTDFFQSLRQKAQTMRDRADGLTPA